MAFVLLSFGMSLDCSLYKNTYRRFNKKRCSKI